MQNFTEASSSWAFPGPKPRSGPRYNLRGAGTRCVFCKVLQKILSCLEVKTSRSGVHFVQAPRQPRMQLEGATETAPEAASSLRLVVGQPNQCLQTTRAPGLFATTLGPYIYLATAPSLLCNNQKSTL